MENQLQFENLIDGLGPGCKNPMMYPAIRYYYCLGCDPKQPEYTDDSKGENGEIRVCESFVDRIWRNDGHEYDDCGVMKSNENTSGTPSAYRSSTDAASEDLAISGTEVGARPAKDASL